MIATAVVVFAAGLSTTASVAAPEPASAATKLKPSPNKNTSEGSVSPTGVALAKARESKKPVEVKAERTATGTVYANPDGTLTHEDAQAPIRAKDAEGKWAPMDTDLVESKGRWVPKVATGDVSFSADGTGTGALFTLSKEASVGLSFKGELGEPAVKGSAATYTVKPAAPEVVTPDSATEEAPATEGTPAVEPSADPGAGVAPVETAAAEKVRLSAGSNGFNVNVILSEAPTSAPSYTFTLHLSGVKAALKDNVLELKNPDGKVVAQSRPMQMWDSARDAAGDRSNMADVESRLVEGTNGDMELTLSPSAKFLNDPKTKYPVTVDPYIEAWEGEGDDTYYFDNQTTTDTRGTDYRLRVGHQDGADYRSLLSFEYKQYVGQTVTLAELKLRQYSSATCTAKQMNMYPVTTDTALPVTWATQPLYSTGLRWKSTKTFNHGQSDDGCPDAFEALDVTAMVNGWAGGQLNGDTAGAHRQGIVLRASTESDSSQEKRFCSRNLSGDDDVNCNDSDYIPVLAVTYAAELGNQSWYSMTDHELNDSSTLSIANKTGNAYLKADDINVNARGLGFNATRSYNSQAQDTTSMGKGWNMGMGADVWLEKKSEYRYDYHAPDGAVFGSFVRKDSDPTHSDYDNFNSPLGGVGADLDQDSTVYKLTFRDSQLVYHFTSVGTQGNLHLAKAVDRSGNEMVYTYTGAKLTTVTDAGGRVYDVTYGTGTSANYITQIKSDTAGVDRTWAYEYTGDYLTKYTDPEGKVTTYGYNTAFSPNVLETITDPVSSTGEHPTTTLVYGSDDDLKVDQVKEVHYVLDGSTTYNYSWDYFDNENDAAECEEHDLGDFATVVTDPNAHKTTFCYKFRDGAGAEMKTWVFDAEGNKRDGDFNIDRQTLTTTSGAGGATVGTYASATPDQLVTVTEPKSDSGTSGARTSYDYDHDHGSGDHHPAGEDYLPGSVTDPNNDCVRYEYDSKGRTTASISKLKGSGSDRSCEGATTGGVKYVFEYNSDGTLAKSADGNAGTLSDAVKTLYTYWASTDTGYVAGSKGLIKSVRKPGGDCTTGVGRKLCTSYTYDDAGRAKTITDGKGIVTTTEYDKNDRTTKVLFNGATSCAIGNTDCVNYVYDAEGNLTQRTESAGTSNFTYDRLNRQITRANPVAVTMGMSYDGVGNLTKYQQSIATTADSDVTYGYDLANSVTSVTDAAGTIDITPDDDARTEKIKFPGTDRVLIDYDWEDSGKPEEATVTNAAGTKLREYTYDYTDGTDDEDQLQTRVTSNTSSALDGTIVYDFDNGMLDTANNSNSGQPDYDYSHDNIGNVASEKIGSTSTYFGYDRAGQLCWRGGTDGTKLGTTCPATPSGDTTLTRDAAGNNTNTTGNPTAYNNHNQATTLGGLAMGYVDLGNDLRASAGTAQFAEGPLGITATKDGSVITFYTRAPDGTILDARVAGASVSKYNYFTEPHNKSVAALYAPDGTEAGSYEYSPYGETTGSGTSAAGNPFRYISGFQDVAGSEDYYKLGARYYDTHGHFTQPDPQAGSISDPKTMTAYNYAAGDPINSADPTGTLSCQWARTCGSTKLWKKAFAFAFKNLVQCTTGATAGLAAKAALAVTKFVFLASGPWGWVAGIVGCAGWVGFKYWTK